MRATNAHGPSVASSVVSAGKAKAVRLPPRLREIVRQPKRPRLLSTPLRLASAGVLATV